MSNTNYSIDDGHGNTIAAGLQPHLARKVAQERADERQESVWLYDPATCKDGLENDGEEITPNIPPSTVTDTQIRSLRDEALASSDYLQVDLCQRALSTDTVDQDGNLIPFADLSQDDARKACATAIASSRTSE